MSVLMVGLGDYDTEIYNDNQNNFVHVGIFGVKKEEEKKRVFCLLGVCVGRLCSCLFKTLHT